MLLKIIDETNSNDSTNAVRVIFEDGSLKIDYLVEDYQRQFKESFDKSLNWYFSEYPHVEEESTNSQGISEKFSKLGQYLGDELLGEEFEQLKIVNHIEKAGYENLDVEIYSSNTDFYSELWEAIILNDSKYYLSSATKSFTRRFSFSLENALPEKHFGLKVEQPTVGIMDDLDVTSPRVANEPLRILYIVSRPDVSSSFKFSDALNMNFNTMKYNGAIELEIFTFVSTESITKRLSNKKSPIHIVHYDGPILISEDSSSLLIDNYNEPLQEILITEFCELLSANDISTLFLSTTDYLNATSSDNELIPASLSHSQALANVANVALLKNVTNVVGLSHQTDPWIAGTCYESLYSQLLKGFTLSQSVIEARKSLQSKSSIQLTSIEPKEFQCWSAILHYSAQEILFFENIEADPQNEQAQGIQTTISKMFGYHNDMLPPIFRPSGDGQVLELMTIESALRRNSRDCVISIAGRAGMSKTQTAHLASFYWLNNGLVDYCFYFDYKHSTYGADDIINMIAPIIESKDHEADSVFEKLEALNCCFVLDSLPSLSEPLNANQEHQFAILKELLKKLSSTGHIVLLVSEQSTLLEEVVLGNLLIKPLDKLEQRKILADTIKLHSDIHFDIESRKHITKFLDSVHGNPWLIKKFVPSFQGNDVEELSEQIVKKLSVDFDDKNCVELFYQWQWELLPLVWRRFIALCNETPALLLEMLMTVTDSDTSYEPAVRLIEELGGKEIKLSDGIECCYRAGLVQKFPHGSLIDKSSISFIASKKDELFSSTNKNEIDKLFSMVLCEGISRLTMHVLKHPNPSVTNNLLLNRRHWVKHFERLWFNNEFQCFFKVKNIFDQLLAQAKLNAESNDWALNLLNRTDEIVVDSKDDYPMLFAWLELVVSAIQSKESLSSDKLSDGLNYVENWLKDKIQDKKELESVHVQACKVLEIYFKLNQEWHKCIHYSELRYQFFNKNQAWRNVIDSLKSLAFYSVKIENMQQALLYENTILSDIPFEGAPQGYREQLAIDILFSRLARKDQVNAQLIISELRDSVQSQQFSEILDGAQCDIHYMNKNYQAALPFYCKIWVRALQAKQENQLLQLKERLQDLLEKLGEEVFDEVFIAQTPEGTMKPTEYNVTLH